MLASAGGASPTIALLNAEGRRRAGEGVLIVDALAPIGSHQESVRVLGRPTANGELVAVAIDRDPVDDVVTRTLIELMLLGTPALALVALGIWLVTGAALRPGGADARAGRGRDARRSDRAHRAARAVMSWPGSPSP